MLRVLHQAAKPRQSHTGDHFCTTVLAHRQDGDTSLTRYGDLNCMVLQSPRGLVWVPRVWRFNDAWGLGLRGLGKHTSAGPAPSVSTRLGFADQIRPEACGTSIPIKRRRHLVTDDCGLPKFCARMDIIAALRPTAVRWDPQ